MLASLAVTSEERVTVPDALAAGQYCRQLSAQLDLPGESAANAYSVLPFASTRTFPTSVFPVWTLSPAAPGAASVVFGELLELP
jgi:hypothetical protein